MNNYNYTNDDENDVAAIYKATTALTTPFKQYNNSKSNNDTIIDLEAGTNNNNSVIPKMNDTTGSCSEQQQQVVGTISAVAATAATTTTVQSQRPSNEYVLNVAFFTFVSFLAIQAIFGIRAHSQAMIADSQAMSVDALTYLFNLLAERMKHMPLTKYEQSLSPKVCAYNRLVRKLYLELIPPALSVITLILVTIYTLQKSTRTLLGINTTTIKGTVSVSTMLLFSIINMLLDIVNVSCFARSNSLFGLGIIHQEQNGSTSCCPTTTTSSTNIETTPLLSKQHHYNHHEHSTLSPPHKKSDSITSTETTSVSNSDCCGCDNTECTSNSSTSSFDMNLENNNYRSLLVESSCDDCEACTVNIHCDDDDDDDDEKLDTLQQPTSFMSNLNMCSAWTHICADTLRSAAVLIAAAIAVLVPNVDGTIADSAAALVVSIIIFFSVFPLIQGLVVTTLELVELHRNPPTDQIRSDQIKLNCKQNNYSTGLIIK